MSSAIIFIIIVKVYIFYIVKNKFLPVNAPFYNRRHKFQFDLTEFGLRKLNVIHLMALYLEVNINRSKERWMPSFLFKCVSSYY